MTRKPLQGVRSVVRFNWHFFVIAAVAITGLAIAGFLLPPPFSQLAWALADIPAAGILLALAATAWAYDLTGFYRFRWLDGTMKSVQSAAHFHAGFDDCSAALRSRFPIEWRVFDFYDARRHTEISIRRARASAEPDRATVAISSNHVPLENSSLDGALLILAAHEIRDAAERAEFFRELRRVVKPGGQIIVAEHLRDMANILAYGPGAWHFHPRSAWLATFAQGGWSVAECRRANRFITLFFLR